MKKGILSHPSALSCHGKVYVGEHLNQSIEQHNCSTRDEADCVTPLPCSATAYSRRLLKGVGNEFEASSSFHQHYGRLTLQELKPYFSNRRFVFQSELRRIMTEVAEKFEHVAATKNLWAAHEAIKTKLVNRKAEKKSEKKRKAERRASSSGTTPERSAEELSKMKLNRARAERMRAGKKKKAVGNRNLTREKRDEAKVSGKNSERMETGVPETDLDSDKKTYSSSSQTSSDSSESLKFRRIEAKKKQGEQRKKSSDTCPSKTNINTFAVSSEDDRNGSDRGINEEEIESFSESKESAETSNSIHEAPRSKQSTSLKIPRKRKRVQNGPREVSVGPPETHLAHKKSKRSKKRKYAGNVSGVGA